MSEPVRLGLIGCGSIAGIHLRETAADPHVRWVAVADVRREAVDALADAFGVPGRYLTAADLLADPAVEAVVVATPPEIRVEPVTAALAAGKHVLVEKPVAVTLDEARAMLGAVRPGLVAACCSCRFRATDSARVAAGVVASGVLGPLRRLVCDVVMPAPEDYDGTRPFYLERPRWGGQGVLADWGVYDLDYLFGLTGWALTPELVLADTRGVPAVYRAMTVPRNDVEVQVACHARLSDGAVLDYRRASFAAAPPHNRWWIEGEDATLDLCLLPGTPQVMLHRLTPTGVVTETVVATADTWHAIHAGPVLDFAGAIRAGRPPLTPLAQAATMQGLADAIYQSAAQGAAATVRKG